MIRKFCLIILRVHKFQTSDDVSRIVCWPFFSFFFDVLALGKGKCEGTLKPLGVTDRGKTRYVCGAWFLVRLVK